MKENQMKKYLIVSSVVISLIMLFFAINLSSKTPDEKVKSFNASIKNENEGNIDKAIESLNLIYAANKENYLLNIRLGWLYYQKKDFSKSKEFYSTSNKSSSQQYRSETWINASIISRQRVGES